MKWIGIVPTIFLVVPSFISLMIFQAKIEPSIIIAKCSLKHQGMLQLPPRRIHPPSFPDSDTRYLHILSLSKDRRNISLRTVQSTYQKIWYERNCFLQLAESPFQLCLSQSTDFREIWRVDWRCWIRFPHQTLSMPIWKSDWSPRTTSFQVDLKSPPSFHNYMISFPFSSTILSKKICNREHVNEITSTV